MYFVFSSDTNQNTYKIYFYKVRKYTNSYRITAPNYNRTKILPFSLFTASTF